MNTDSPLFWAIFGAVALIIIVLAAVIAARRSNKPLKPPVDSGK